MQSNEARSFISSHVARATGVSAVVDCMSESIVVNSINCSLLCADTRCRQTINQAAHSRQALVAELAARCPPLTVYGPTTTSRVASEHSVDDQTVWNHCTTRPFDAVDMVSPSEAARLTDNQVKLIGDHTLDKGSIPDQLDRMLRETVEHYINRELDQFAADVIPALFDVLTARQATLNTIEFHFDST